MAQYHLPLRLLLAVLLAITHPPLLAVAQEISSTSPKLTAEAELRAVVASIASDAMAANIEGLQGIHLDSEKFSKFGPRSFDRQDVASTNASEAAFFSSVTGMKYEARDLKVDVFDNVGVVTYYPHVTFEKDGEDKVVDGRQTLVLLRTPEGWKIVHEHGTVRK